MNQTTLDKIILRNKIDDRRKVGKPKLKWLKDTENDLRELEVKRWRKRGNNGEAWASVVKDTKDFKDSKIVLGI
jgi:hypothetical protein